MTLPFAQNYDAAGLVLLLLRVFSCSTPYPGLRTLFKVYVCVAVDLAAAASGGGDATTFKLHSNKDGLEIRVGATPTTTLVIVKGECIVPASVYELREFISGHSTLEFNTMMHESDVMFMDGRVMRRYEGRGSEFDATGINIPARLASVLPCRHDVWSVFRLPFPLWARDFVFMEAIHRVFVDAAGAWRLAAAGTEPGPSEREFVLTISNSCVREDCGDLEKSNSFVRGLVALAGYVVTAAPDSTAAAPKSILTYVNLADAKGSIPGTMACSCQWCFFLLAASIRIRYGMHMRVLLLLPQILSKSWWRQTKVCLPVLV